MLCYLAFDTLIDGNLCAHIVELAYEQVYLFVLFLDYCFKQ